MFSFTVKSSRYTLQELKNATKVTEMFKDEIAEFIVFTGNGYVDDCSENALGLLQEILQDDISNDLAKYCMPEAYKTSLVLTSNARALQNFLELRTSKHALWEIQDLARAMYEVLPEEHKFMFSKILHDA